MKRIGILALLLFFVSAGLVFAQWGDTSVSSAPKIIKSKTIHKPARDSGLNDAGMWQKWVIIRVELREETGGNNKGQRYTFLTVTGLLHEGGRVEKLSGSDLQFYQSNYGGRRSEYEYDDIR